MSFLVVEDEPPVQRAIVRALRPFGASRVTATVAEANEMIDEALSLLGAVIDLGLGENSGMSVVARVRARWAALPVLVLTGRARPEEINDAQLLRAEFVVKGTAQVQGCLQGFGLRAVSAHRLEDPRTRAAVERVAKRAGLSAGQAAVLATRVAGTTAISTAHALGLSERAVRAQVERTLAKTGHDRMEDLVSEVLRGALSA